MLLLRQIFGYYHVIITYIICIGDSADTMGKPTILMPEILMGNQCYHGETKSNIRQ
jgi:hypothetical protein